jgi:hypothetical protein
VQPDLELTTAHRDLLELDHAIAQLYNRLGDTIDGDPDFLHAEEWRGAALERLATVPAVSPAGLVAKAKALTTLSLTEDPDRTSAIAASLADDVIKHFDRAS